MENLFQPGEPLLSAAGVPGEVHIEQDDIERMFPEESGDVSRAPFGVDIHPMLFQEEPCCHEDVFVIIDDENFAGCVGRHGEVD